MNDYEGYTNLSKSSELDQSTLEENYGYTESTFETLGRYAAASGGNLEDDTTYSSSDASNYTDSATVYEYEENEAVREAKKRLHGSYSSSSYAGSYSSSAVSESTPTNTGHQSLRVSATQYTERDWNREFQNIMENAQFLFTEPALVSAAAGQKDNFSALSLLAEDFIYAAKLYAKVIISEMHIPVEHKTIKPIKLGGVAGGDKYVCGGILFKFALDTRGLYGGDEFAMKAAAHELKGLQCLFQVGTPLQLNFPLMSVIDYRGYRVVALSVLPISSDSIIYGSADAGATVHASNNDFNARMQQATAKLNLKPHKVGAKLTTICGPGDIEGHKSQLDGKYYVVDYARLMPPQVRLETSSTKHTHLYQLLRPEFVLANEVPLSSDALTGLSRHDPDRQFHNSEVVEACQRLFESIIPSFAQQLASESENSISAGSRLCGLLHRAGINLRHLGRVWVLTPAPARKTRMALLTEMLARIMKDDIKSQLRATMRRVRVPSEGPYRQAVIDYLNNIFVISPAEYWGRIVPQRVQQKFGVAPPKELKELSGIKLAPGAAPLLQLGTSLLTGRDAELRVVVKNMNIVDQSAACSLSVQALQRDGSESQRIFGQAYALFLRATSTVSLNWSTYYQWGASLRALSHRMTHLQYGVDSIRVLREALLRLERSVNSNRNFHGSRVEALLTILDLITHKGRDLLPEDARKLDTSKLFRFAEDHCSNALVLEIVSSQSQDPSVQRSVARFKQAVNDMDDSQLFSMVQILLNITETSETSLLKSSRAQSASNAYEGLRKEYLNEILSTLRKKKSISLKSATFFNNRTMKTVLEFVSPRRLRRLIINHSHTFDSDLLELSSQSSKKSSRGSLSSDSLSFGPLASHLKLLQLSRCNGLSHLPANLYHVKSLNLSNTNLNDQQILSALPAMRKLEVLDVSCCKGLSNKFFEGLSAAPPTKLQTLTVTKLDFGGRPNMPLGSPPLGIIDPIVAIPSLTKLDLTGIHTVGKPSLQKIADACSLLEYLNLNSSHGVTDSALLPVLKKCVKLRQLDIGSTEITNSTLKSIGQYLSMLTRLCLRQNHGLHGDCGLSHVLHGNMRLESLDMSNLFKITDATFAFMTTESFQFTSLRELVLDLATSLSNQSLWAITHSFKELRSLSVTAFPSVLTASLAAIGQNTYLQKVWLHKVDGVTGEGLNHIFRGCTNLTSLSVAECQGVTDRTLLELASNVTSLTELDISDLPHISPPVIQQILQRNRGLKKLFAYGPHLPDNYLNRECRHNCPELDILVDGRKYVTPCLWTRPEQVDNVDRFWERLEQLNVATIT